ncbi:MAG: riboflavin synthase [Lentisphaerota bacterium]
MFTGIIEELGQFRGINSGDNTSVISVGCKDVLQDIKIGDSIAVNGVCLTIISFNSDSLKADVMPETLRKSNLGKLKRNDVLNLERALKASDRFGGHIVSGHIDGIGIIKDKKIEKNAILISFKAHRDILRYIVQKGSVAIDGISLTVTFVDSESFGVSLIPLTAKLTTLGFKKSGDEVNIECDIVGKYIEKFISEGRSNTPKSKLDEHFLKDHGFA